ncbi:MAG: RNA polymerase sigma factor [Patescibacteria group bacterium]
MEHENQKQKLLSAYELYADALFRHAYVRVRDRARARDFVQEAFIRTWQYFIGGKDADNIRAFLYKTLTNLIIDESRKKRESSLEILHDAGFSPVSDERGPEANAELFRATRAIENIEEPYRTAVIMRYIDDLQPKEIADILGESENTVSVRIHRGVKKLRDTLGS